MAETPVAGQVAPDPGAPVNAAPAGPPPAAAAPAPVDAKAERGSTPVAAVAAPKPPEKYALVIPKGAETFVDLSDLTIVEHMAKEEAWTNEQAQEFVQMQTDLMDRTLKGLRTETEADPVYGGAKLEETLQHVHRGIDRVRPKGHPRAESFRRFLEKTGAGNHIEFVSFLADLGKLMREDTPPQQTASSRETKRAPETVLYPEGKTT